MYKYICIFLYTKNRNSYLKFFMILYDSLNVDQVIESLSCVPVHLHVCVCVYNNQQTYLLKIPVVCE